MIKKGTRVIDKISGERGEIWRRKGFSVFVDWDHDGGTHGEIPWPITDFVPETPKNISRYCKGE
jgi:hypothetical protein